MARPAVFINPDLNTPEDIARAQALLGAIAPNYGKAANVGEGIAQLMIGVGTGVKNRKLAKAETAGRAQGNSAFEKIMGAMSGANTQFPAAPSMGGEQAVSAPSATGVDVAKRLQADFNLTPEAAAGFAGNLAHESGNFKTLQEINPTVKGSRGGFGWAQWTGPRRRQFEAYAAANKLDPTSPEANYGFLKNELQGPEGRVLKALQGVSDPNKAAQIVSDTFLRPGIPHMQSRISKTQAIVNALRGGGDPGIQANPQGMAIPDAGIQAMPQGAGNPDPGIEVASLDPSVGMPQQMYVGQVNPNGSIGTVAQKPGIQAIAAAMGQPASNGMAAPQQAPQQMAQAAPSDIPPMPQNEASSLDRIIGMNTPLGAPQPQGLDVSMLMQAAQNPWLTDTQKTMVNTLLQQEMQKQDPAYQMQQQAAQVGLQRDQLQLEQMRDPSKVPMTPMQQLQMQKSQLELQQLQNPAPDAVEVNGRLVDRRTGNVIYESPAGSAAPNQPSSIQEYEYFSKLPPDQQKQYLAVKRAQQTLDLGSNFGILDPTNPGQVSISIPKDIEGKVLAEVAAKDKGDNLALLNSMKAKMPGLEAVVKELNAIGKEATYTLSGQILNEGRKQLGMAPSDGAIARTKYGAVVANQVLPLLRDTFGAQFTAAEGDRLLATLGDPDVSPAEKEAVLNAFIEQKKRDIEGLAVQTGQQPAPSSPATPNVPKRLKYNPATGELE